MAARQTRKPLRQPELELTVTALGGRGDGIAEHRGTAVFLPLTVPGDRVRVALGERRGEGIAGEALELLASGPDRAEPPCPHFGACGGCQVQHLRPEAYAAWKADLAAQALARRGLDTAVLTPLAALPPAGRRRAVFAARRGRSAVFLGFNERLSHRIVDLETCLVVRPEIAALLPRLRPVLAEVMAESEAMDVAVTLLEDGLDLVLAAAREPDLAARERLAAFAEAEDLARLSWRRGADGPAEPVAHRRPGIVRFGGVPVVVPPGGFLQASAEGEAVLVRLVTAAVGEAARVADLFAGCGTFTFPLATSGTAARRVRAVDGDLAAFAALNRAARQAGLGERVTASARDLAHDPLTPAELAEYDAVVFDPPRAGAREQAAALAASAVPVVVGISCNPASFARDARMLVDGGYRLERVTPVDQFLWSPHLELVGVFRRQ